MPLTYRSQAAVAEDVKAASGLEIVTRFGSLPNASLPCHSARSSDEKWNTRARKCTWAWFALHALFIPAFCSKSHRDRCCIDCRKKIDRTHSMRERYWWCGTKERRRWGSPVLYDKCSPQVAGWERGWSRGRKPVRFGRAPPDRTRPDPIAAPLRHRFEAPVSLLPTPAGKGGAAVQEAFLCRSVAAWSGPASVDSS